MKDKKWVDCPSCGSKKSMIFKISITENYTVKNYGSIKIRELEGYFCKVCKDGIFTKKSQSHINAVIAEFKARIDAKSVVAADLSSVDEMAKKLQLTRQSIHKMMNTGKMRYVFVGDIRLPLRNQALASK